MVVYYKQLYFSRRDPDRNPNFVRKLQNWKTPVSPIKRLIPGELILIRTERRVEAEIAGVRGNYERFSMGQRYL